MNANPRGPGMDHDLYDYTPITARAALPLDGKRLAVYIVLHLEYWELCTPPGSYRDPRFKGEFGTFTPEFRTWTSREYGNRVGVYRILDLLDAMGLPATVALGAALVQTHPELVGEILRRGWEVVTHGFSSNRMITSRMSEQEEHDFISTARRIVAEAIGEPSEGWMSQDYGATPRTTSLLHSLGFSFSLDWTNDELPYWQRAGKVARGLVALPAPSELDDVQTIGLRKILPERFPLMVQDALQGWSGFPMQRVLPIGIHPWLFGAPHRIRYLREALALLREQPDILITTAGDVARRFRNINLEATHHA